MFVANFSPPSTQTMTTIVSPPSAGIASGAGGYPYGTNVTATAANPCHAFVNWTDYDGTVVAASPDYSFVAETNTTLVANFALIPVSVLTGSSLGGFTTGGGTYSCGSSVTVCASPSPCYQFTGWTENGIPLSGSLCYTFTITASRYLVAHFPPTSVFGDGISDCWRLQYFGTVGATNSYSCATCDADGTGQKLVQVCRRP